MCNCKKKDAFKVKLPGGLEVSKATEAAARAFAAKHPGATVVKSGS